MAGLSRVWRTSDASTTMTPRPIFGCHQLTSVVCRCPSRRVADVYGIRADSEAMNEALNYRKLLRRMASRRWPGSDMIRRIWRDERMLPRHSGNAGMDRWCGDGSCRAYIVEDKPHQAIRCTNAVWSAPMASRGLRRGCSLPRRLGLVDSAVVMSRKA